MKKVIILLTALIVLSLIVSSCGKLVYKTEGTGDDMYIASNMGKCYSVSDSIWELAYKTRIEAGSLDNGEYLLYKDINDVNSSILKVGGYTSKSPYPKFFVNEKYDFPEFKSEYIYIIRFLKVDSYEKYLNINTNEKTQVSFIDRWDTPEMIEKLYDTVIARDNKADQYPDFEDFPKLGFLNGGVLKIKVCSYLPI